MGFKQIAVALAVMATAAGAASQAVAGEPWDPRQATSSVMYFVSIPLDAQVRKERAPYMGMKLQGSREYHSIVVDTRMLNFIDGGISAKFLIAGAVAVAGAVVAGSGGGGGGGGGQTVTPEQQAAIKAASTGSTGSTSSTSSTSTSSTTGSTGGSGSTGGTAPAPCPPVTCPK